MIRATPRHVIGLLALLSVIIQSMPAQTAIVIDFKNRSMKNKHSLESLRQGDLFRLEIENLNLNLYKVSVGKSDAAVVKPTTIPGFGSFATNELSQFLTALSPLGGIAGVSTARKSTHDTINHIIDNFLDALKSGNKSLLELKSEEDGDHSDGGRLRLAGEAHAGRTPGEPEQLLRVVSSLSG